MTTVVTRVEVPGDVYAWARTRSGVPEGDLARRFPRLNLWESGTAQPTLKQLEGFAQATHTPVGFFFLSEPPPDAPLPLPDFRTVHNRTVNRPSPNLLETIFECQQRQEWYAGYLSAHREGPLPFVGSVTTGSDPISTAARLRDELRFAPEQRGPSWSEALRRLAEHAEDMGILVMINGVVGSNTHRKLDPGEFRGFSLIDNYAPLIFVNGADTKAAQIFTLAHELAHVWLGQSGIDDIELEIESPSEVENWCNTTAAELLVPLSLLRGRSVDRDSLTIELDSLAAEFRVSTLVSLIRLRDAGLLTSPEFHAHYDRELSRVMDLKEQAASESGGNFYNTQPVRMSKSFTRALISSTLEGQTLHRDAFQLLGFKKYSTFHELASRLGVE